MAFLLDTLRIFFDVVGDSQTPGERDDDEHIISSTSSRSALSKDLILYTSREGIKKI